MKLSLSQYIGIALVIVALGLYGLLSQRPWQTFGSVETGGNAYLSTTTPAVADVTNLCIQQNNVASSSFGILGSVNILKSGAGELVIYDATTTNANLRSADQATSSLILTDFGTSPTVGSYHFDIEFKRGLLVDYTTTGTGVSSTTISYRCGSAQ